MKVVSSAKVNTFEFGTAWLILLIYMRKNVVDNVLPCGIPCVIICGWEMACWVCCLFAVLKI